MRSRQGMPFRNCPYCGLSINPFRLVCREHADLPGLDPFFTNPRIVAKPIGVQPFAAPVSGLGSKP